MRCVLDGGGGVPMVAHKSQLLDLQNNFNVNFFFGRSTGCFNLHPVHFISSLSFLLEFEFEATADM